VIQQFPDFIHFDSETPWKSSVTLPIGLKYVYGLSFPSDVTAFDNINNYFESIRSIIMIYESALDLKGVINSRRVIEESEVQPLSERQNKILDLLKTGRTNKEIAEVIGYSESLVRHETMIIYKKLRVEGRNQLRESS
jgi:DNA-binding CsgD family transcriptional regulator